jgi:hypothetical protein
MSQLSPEQLVLYKEIDNILFYTWDPIGISDIEDARDEYYAYLPTVFKLVLSNSTAEIIANYLAEVTMYMGLDPNRTHDLKVASMLLETKEKTE